MGLEEEKASESEASDMVNELSNMICGNLCSRLDKKTVWELTIPHTQPVSRQEIRNDPSGSGVAIDFDADGQRIKLNIQFNS
jgi:CheY-specific phosphatase CheX